MWIENSKNGKYLFREKYIDRLTGKEKTASITFEKDNRKTRAEASRLLNAKIAKINSKNNKVITPITFKELVDNWEKIYTSTLSPNTVLSVKANIKILTKSIGNDTLVDKINSIYLTKKIEGLMFGDENISESYAKTLKTRLNKIFEYGISHGHLENNPIEKVKVPKKKKDMTNIKEFFLEQEELDRLMNYLQEHNYRYYLLAQWLYLNGLRAGEGVAMQKSDVVISEDRQYCIVNGTLEYHGKKINEQIKSKNPKTFSGFREVDLNSKAIEIYNEAVKLTPNSDFLFTTSNNTPIQINALNTYFRKHKERMGFAPDKDLSTHIFRHTHVSKLAEVGVPLHVIQRRVGHKNEGITKDIYLHITQRMKNETKSLLEFL
ncbi:tyrosine-type recombinase/integrase [Lactococcus garvieae]|uniref:tyrosine-type recombinase/integrase n=1 Tax=Lactococcus garvieae TaxID=1363 RepID=UPI00398E4401